MSSVEKSTQTDRLQGSWSSELITLVAAFVATIAMAHLYCAADLPLERDNQAYFFMAERTASGVSPFEALFQPKTVLSILLDGATIFAGRLVGVPDIVAARSLALVVLALTLWLLWRLTLELTRSERAAAFACLSMLSFSGYWYLGLMGSRPKILLVLFIVWTMHLFVKGRHLAAGVAVSMAILCWQPAIMMLGGMIVLLLAQRGMREPFKRMLIGAAVAVLMYELYFVLDGSFKEQLIQTLYFPAKYMQPELFNLGRSTSEIWALWQVGFGELNLMPWLTMLGVASLGVAYLRRIGGASSAGVIDQNWLFVGLCLLGWAVFAWYDHQGYPDLFVLLPFLSLIAGVTLDRWATRLRRLSPLFVALTLSYFGFLIFYGLQLQEPSLSLDKQQKLARRVGRFLRNGQTIYAIGSTELLAFNHTSNWTKYAFFFRGLGEFLRAERGGADFSPEIDGQWPSIVLLHYSHRRRRAGEGWLGQHYRNDTPGIFKSQGVLLYRLKEPNSAPSVRSSREIPAQLPP